jgi:predicted RNase H-like HicB family nuclease
MEIGYTYWQEPDGFYLGYLNFWPEHWTQGKSIQELEAMLLDLYEIYLEEAQEKKTDQVPRHPLINNNLARQIIKNLS